MDELRRLIFPDWQAMPIVWEHTGDGEFPYRAQVQGQTFIIRINDFPDEPVYTLIIDDDEFEDIEDWPPIWVRPPIPQSLLDLLDATKPNE